MNKRVSTASLITVLSAALLAAGCANSQYSSSQIGTAIGVAGGAVLGAAVSSKKDRTKGAIIGAVGGGLAGYAVGTYMDNQAKDFEKQLAPQIKAGAIELQRNADKSLTVVMTSSTAFDSGSSALKGGFLPTLDTISAIVKKYGKTTLDIEGHTDASGNDRINQPLSEQRAAAVEQYLQAHGVQQERMQAIGYGSSRPRADNNTEAGKQLNRRVEIHIVPVVQ
ncbi:OmpA family protein [Vogesella sp. LIG4]|uniref:OmpA family protein n=1 Tax=Vogesella sp. LIG4 TaxID=1192162 RepID=UPI00081F789A|nr:OmpA family protein [Vogesella sp. LIG4]SCK07243.1 Outer membrane protein OmpA [Vogesella sp. LIG4]